MEKTTVEENIIEKVKNQTQELWETIQEAKKSNLKIEIGFYDFLTEPQIRIIKELFSQSVEIRDRIISS